MRERRRPMRLEPRNPPSDVPHDGLRSWPEVSRIWHLRTGQKLTHQRLVQISQVAIRKLRKAIESDPKLCEELLPDDVAEAARNERNQTNRGIRRPLDSTEGDLT